MKKFLAEFKEFAMKGNVLDMAIGIIVGAAFTSIVNSLVDDIISPVIGLLVRVNFNDLAVSVFGVDLKYGSFIMAIINFVIVAFALFVLVRRLIQPEIWGKKQKWKKLRPQRNAHTARVRSLSMQHAVRTVLPFWKMKLQQMIKSNR